ncbi:uncharacterized protein BJX67DRAFT_241480 [Aspergillus lucknowensis]|uniref:PARP-type domain-containing protein n=1 Tax=Aspergillus lucknowensis TaxID=176173 RepID=A0ABR4LGL2_9EURO
MPSYRVELARTGRAGCTNKECKDNKVKIPQGELRFGSWVDTERIQAFFWRHWGCVTPKIVSNIKELVGEGDDRDLDLLDGYDELPSEMQEKVVRALDQGHVDDEDWKGDPEMNEPGKSGFRVRTPRKKAAQASDKGEESQEEEPIKTSKPKKRSRFEVAEDEDEETRPRKPKRKSTGYPKDKPISDDNQTDGESPVPAQAKTKSSKRGRKAKDEDSAATPASKRAKKAKKQDDNDAEAEPSAEKPKRGRRKKAA